jgi:hypothetical protein
MGIKEDIIFQIRECIHSRSSLNELDDGALYTVFSLFRANSSNQEVSQWLRERDYLPNITRQSLPKILAGLKRKIAPMLMQAKNIDRNRRRGIEDIHLPDLKTLDSLERLEAIEKTYSELIGKELRESIDGAPLPVSLARHVQALSTLQKSRQKLQDADDAKPKPKDHLTDDERATGQNFLAKVRESGQAEAMVASARSFLKMIEDEPGVEIDEVTGEIIQ